MDKNELIRAIHACRKCKSIGGNRRVILKEKKIPSDYGITPEKVNVVFVAESPPLSGRYFYCEGKPAPVFRAGLSEMLFSLLVEVGLMEKPTLKEFKDRGYYLDDATKCPFQRADRNIAPPRRALENCRSFLLQEISFYKPTVICTLGKTALKAFLKTNRFRLSDYAGKVIDNSDLRDDIAHLNIPVVACWFPLSMVSRKTKLEAIKKIPYSLVI